ncbi:NAD(P)H-hydrate dehydratase [uncultured Pseudodesulfovibrio sp.]|uniref:NAD(P)H-hydrate dehydratase n=1 Tax=uncultured Pseudodesulfovibrio sp. TaxID=2035858 RepID=UPI0029C817B2|nr:NAD(P)H-hydrate dehydratase [uncultured Pseudodesulfovibrio sp.]
MFLPLPTPAEMVIWDRETIQTIGIPGVTLMESASREALDVLLSEYGPVRGKEIFCFVGAGNNGGDALAVARHLTEHDAEVTVFHTKPKKNYRGETRTNLKWAQKLGIPLKYLPSVDFSTLPQPDIIIDGLLGTGFQGELRADTLDLIRTINRMGDKAFILALDIPSGLNGMTGSPQPEAIMADVTVTFQAAKLGLAMPGAARHTGMLDVRTIGIPRQIREQHPVRHHLISQMAMSRIPTPSHDMHKGGAGHVLVIGGSRGLTGAPHLSALAALRSGAGLVTIACPGGLAGPVKACSPDIMTLPLGTGVEWKPAMMELLEKELPRFDAVVVGPGLGRTGKTVDFIRAFVAKCPAQVVFDADALFALAQNAGLISELPPTTILTPHPGEMARLLNTTNAAIQNDRLEAVNSFVAKYAATLVLKGAGTLVANSEITCISPFSEPNLSIGGSGDVLSGVIASLLARKMTPIHAASIGVYWHGLTGRMLREDFPTRGNLASEIANMLPLAAKESTC